MVVSHGPPESSVGFVVPAEVLETSDQPNFSAVNHSTTQTAISFNLAGSSREEAPRFSAQPLTAMIRVSTRLESAATCFVVRDTLPLTCHWQRDSACRTEDSWVKTQVSTSASTSSIF